jgi:type II secretory pathway predicted ATPase ExeA
MKTPRWLTAFGLSRPPFAKDIADADLWLPEARQAIVDELVSGSAEADHVLLVGEPGVGKTCVPRALRRRLPEAGFRLTYCHNATLGRRDFYRQLCLALGLSPKATAAALFYAVSSHVEELGRERVHPVFLLDEAHLLHQDVLDQRRICAALAHTKTKRRVVAQLVGVVLVPPPHRGQEDRGPQQFHKRTGDRLLVSWIVKLTSEPLQAIPDVGRPHGSPAPPRLQ